MITLTIDNKKVQVPPDSTILQAARSAGIYIPALCYKEGCKPATSCMVCVVHVEGTKNLVPSCGLRVSEGMRVITQSDEIQNARTAAIELLLSDHSGDCVGPCENGCPANMDIPQMLRQIAAGDLKAAIRTIKKDIPLPAILGRICPAPCEKVCRRAGADGAVAICLLKKFAADADLASEIPYQPEWKKLTGRKAAVIGAGPAGLSAAYYLRQGGVACDLYDDHPQPGGALRYSQIDRDLLPESVVDAEIRVLMALQIHFVANFRLGRDAHLHELEQKYDAVLLAIGTLTSQAELSEIASKDGKIKINHQDYSVLLPDNESRNNVFAAGACIGSRHLCVRAVADGKEAAQSILQRLGLLANPVRKPYNHRLGRMEKDQLEVFLKHSSLQPRLDLQNSQSGYTDRQAADQALRCLHCDCGKKDRCGLRDLATEFKARQKTWSGQVSLSGIQDGGEIIYDPGKCIKCGLCVQTARQAGEKMGLAFEGRGFGMKIAVPLNKPLDQKTLKFAEKYVSVCPTGALTLKNSGT